MLEKQLGGRKPGRFGTLAGVLAGLVAGIGISVAYALLSASARSARTPVASLTALPLPSPVGRALNQESLAEQHAEQVNAHRESVARHEREPRDSLWAIQTEQVLKNLLTELAKRGSFQITSVDCRTSSCVAYLRSASFQDARMAWPSVVNARNDLKCDTEVTLNEPQPGESTFDFSVVYDCSKVRQAQAGTK